MVFRKESRADSFQRHISHLRQQLETDAEDEEFVDDAEPMPDDPDSREPIAPVPIRATADVVSRQPLPSPSGAATGVIAVDSAWSGTLRSQGSLQIYGRVEGDLTADGEIFVAEGAVVSARISARVIVVAGSVDGTIACSGRLEVLPSGVVSGEITAPSLVVHEGATIEGDLRMQDPAVPAESRA